MILALSTICISTAFFSIAYAYLKISKFLLKTTNIEIPIVDILNFTNNPLQ